MATHRTPRAPTNRNADGEKNVRDPSEHPQGIADSPSATSKRERVSGDAPMRLPFEHDETGGPEERAHGTQSVMEQAERDATGPQEDTDVREDAVKIFNRKQGPAPKQR